MSEPQEIHPFRKDGVFQYQKDFRPKPIIEPEVVIVPKGLLVPVGAEPPPEVIVIVEKDNLNEVPTSPLPTNSNGKTTPHVEI